MMLLLVEFACTPSQMPVIHGLEFFNHLSIVNRRERGGDLGGPSQIGGPHRGLITKDHVTHQVVHGRKQQLTGVMGVGGTFVELLELLGPKTRSRVLRTMTENGPFWTKRSNI
jgi:hypothetical protein